MHSVPKSDTPSNAWKFVSAFVTEKLYGKLWIFSK